MTRNQDAVVIWTPEGRRAKVFEWESCETMEDVMRECSPRELIALVNKHIRAHTAQSVKFLFHEEITKQRIVQAAADILEKN